MSLSKRAIAELGRSIGIREIDRAAVVDHKDVYDNPPIDRSLDRPGRMHKALELLQSARGDISREEDNPRAIAWRDAAYQHIDKGRELHPRDP